MSESHAWQRHKNTPSDPSPEQLEFCGKMHSISVTAPWRQRCAASVDAARPASCQSWKKLSWRARLRLGTSHADDPLGCFTRDVGALVHAAGKNHSVCTDSTSSWRLNKGESLDIHSPVDCTRQVSTGSHAYLRHLTVDATDGSKLLVSFSNASDAPLVKPNAHYFEYHKPIGKNEKFHHDVAVSITCNNYWAACPVRVQAVFGCFVPCCYTALSKANRNTSASAKDSKFDIICSDGSKRSALATEDTVGYADEESVKFVQVRECRGGFDPHTVATPAPLCTPTHSPLDFFDHDAARSRWRMLELQVAQREELAFQSLSVSATYSSRVLAGDQRLYAVDSGD